MEYFCSVIFLFFQYLTFRRNYLFRERDIIFLVLENEFFDKNYIRISFIFDNIYLIIL